MRVFETHHVVGKGGAGGSIPPGGTTPNPQKSSALAPLLPAAQNGKMGRNGAKTPAIERGESVDFSHGLFFGAVASPTLGKVDSVVTDPPFAVAFSLKVRRNGQ